MNCVETFYKKNITYTLLNKFEYNCVKKISKLKKITLHSSFSASSTLNFKNQASGLLALELISSKKGKFVIPNTFKKVKNNSQQSTASLSSCKTNLKRKRMYRFLFKFVLEILPNMKNNTNFFVKAPKKFKNSISYTLKEPSAIHELDKNFYLFGNLKNLQIIFITDSVSKKETLFLLRSLKINAQ